MTKHTTTTPPPCEACGNTIHVGQPVFGSMHRTCIDRLLSGRRGTNLTPKGAESPSTSRY